MVEGGLPDGWAIEVGVLPGDFSALPRCLEAGEGKDSGGVLPGLRVQPQVCDTQAFGSAAWQQAQVEAPWGAWAALRVASDFDSAGGLGGGGVSVVGEVEGDGAAMDAVDTQAFPCECRGGAAAAFHQRPADGPAAGRQQAASGEALLRADTAGDAFEAPQPYPDGQLRVVRSQIWRGRSGLALRQQRGRPICLLAQLRRHPHSL